LKRFTLFSYPLRLKLGDRRVVCAKKKGAPSYLFVSFQAAVQEVPIALPANRSQWYVFALACACVTYALPANMSKLLLLVNEGLLVSQGLQLKALRKALRSLGR
jgi:hypothetical protein